MQQNNTNPNISYHSGMLQSPLYDIKMSLLQDEL